jgi:hypothetical protein
MAFLSLKEKIFELLIFFLREFGIFREEVEDELCCGPHIHCFAGLCELNRKIKYLRLNQTDLTERSDI